MKTPFRKNVCNTISVLALIFIFNYKSAHCQVVVEDSISIEFLVNEVLIGGGISAENITFNGQPAEDLLVPQLGRFTVDSSAFPIAEGLVMGTAFAAGITGEGEFPSENFQNDPDLMAISGQPMNNCAIIEFDFTATTDTFLIDYIFASTEYPGFTCSQFNDAFGIFLSGPGIDGPFMNNAKNIALIPGTDIPVSINTVNSGWSSSGNPDLCFEANPNFVADSIYFFENEPQMENSITYPGHTHILTAFAELIPGETYHFKFAIGNALDQALQSAVMMRKESVASGLITEELQIEVNTENLIDPSYEIYIAGTFNYFVPELMEEIGPNLYQYSTQVADNVNVTYKFFNGIGPEAAEIVPDQCGIGGKMPNGNRYFATTANPQSIEAVCYNTCDFCLPVLSTDEKSEPGFSIFPNPSDGNFQIVPPVSGLARIQAFDIQGRMIFDRQVEVVENIPFGFELQEKGLYKIRLSYTAHKGLVYAATIMVN